MSQSNNFTSGFFLGAFLGGLVGGVAGVLAANRMYRNDPEADVSFGRLSDEIKQNLADMSSDERMEVARRGLKSLNSMRPLKTCVSSWAQPTVGRLTMGPPLIRRWL